MRRLFFSFLLFFVIFTANAQPPCSGPGRTATGAQAVCGNLTFVENDVTPCTGQGDLPNPTSGCAPVSTDNSRWYKFHCYQAGTLGFLINPNSPADDYDWEVMDITGHVPDDVYIMELRASLNLSGQTGVTGCTAAGTTDINCEGGGPGTQFNRLMNLQTGHDYLMMVTNWSASLNPYTIVFSGTAVLTLNTPPTITSVDMVRCDPSKLKVTFSEDILCSSITNSGSEFGITIAGQVVTGITSDCSLPGAYGVTSLIINLQTPIPTGTYQLDVDTSLIDGDIFRNVCRLEMLPASIPFTVTAPISPVFDSVQYDRCTPSQIKVFYSKPIDCNTVLAGGMQFFITGPSPVSVISATPPCGAQNWFLLDLSAPIINFGTYTLHNRTFGGITISDTCGLNQNSNDIIAFDVQGPASAAFTNQVKWGCVMDTIVLSHPGGNGVNSWIWHFSDGSSATGQTVTKMYPVTDPSFDAELIVSNGFCSDTVTNNIVLGNFFKAGFSNNPVDSFCVNAPVTFTDTSKGNISNYLWDFGDLMQVNGQVPPAHVYLASKNYTIKLTVTDIHGCTDTATVNRFVTPTPVIDFTGLNPQYCTGNKVFLRRKISPFITGYVWDNGDGKTFTNEVDVNFSYAKEGVYTITLSGVDRYCGTATVSKTVPVYKVPIVKLPADTVLCQNEPMLIGVAPTANYNYLWNTGATTSQVLTDNFTRDYRLTADNKGCKGIDVMHVKVLTACLIKVPNAFTPNRDGLNDELKAENADLARNFSFKIFNRIGQLCFSTNSPLEGWDGRLKGNPQEMGTYVWMLSYTNPWTGKYVKEKGTSILLR
jgi:gliding motility-associated-like protein